MKTGGGILPEIESVYDSVKKWYMVSLLQNRDCHVYEVDVVKETAHYIVPAYSAKCKKMTSDECYFKTRAEAVTAKRKAIEDEITELRNKLEMMNLNLKEFNENENA